jgi:hypothetical protein
MAEGKIFNLTGDGSAIQGIVVPRSATLFVAKCVVDPSVKWKTLLKEACPQDQSQEVLDMGDKFPREDGIPKQWYIYGLNFGTFKQEIWQASAWAKRHDLLDATPRQIYSLTRDVPDLCSKVGVSWMKLIAPEPYESQDGRKVCIAEFVGPAEHHAEMVCFLGLGDAWLYYAWFCFARECSGEELFRPRT